MLKFNLRDETSNRALTDDIARKIKIYFLNKTLRTEVSSNVSRFFIYVVISVRSHALIQIQVRIKLITVT